MTLTQDASDDIVRRYVAGESLREIEATVPVGRTTVARILAERGVPRVGTGNARGRRVHTVDSTYFSAIDTDEKAYWLGFICADGHVGDDGITVTLKDVDAAHLTKLAAALGSSAKPKIGQGRATLSVWSIELVAQLRSLGLNRQKSSTLEMPVVAETHHRHFVRGVFDGDGSIKITTRLKSRYTSPTTEYTVMLCGTASFTESLRDIVASATCASRPQLQNRGGLTVVEWSGRRQALSILDWMYGESTVALDRKLARWHSIPRHP